MAFSQKLAPRLRGQIAGLAVVLAALCGQAAEAPQVEISNRQIRAKLYLPDAENGFYRGTRFDWSGMIGSLQYRGHDFYGPWFDRVDPKVLDYVHQGDEVIAGPSSAATGPAEEFQTRGTALGWDEAKAGETFVKIGVGVLRKDVADYSYAKLYEIVDPGKWTVRNRRGAVDFTQKLADPASGYAYLYHKTVRLAGDKAEMQIQHRLKNTGNRPIETSVYNHNFLVLDRRPPGPSFVLTLPYPIHSERAPDPALVEIRGNRLSFAKTLEGRDRVYTVLGGFGPQRSDHEIRIEHQETGLGMKIQGDRPLHRNALWAMCRVMSVEPFIAMNLDPGKEFSWSWSYQFYPLP